MNNQLTSDHRNELPLPPKSPYYNRSAPTKPSRYSSGQDNRDETNILDQIPPTPRQQLSAKDRSSGCDNSNSDNAQSAQSSDVLNNQISNRDQINCQTQFAMTSNNYLSHSSLGQSISNLPCESSHSENSTSIGAVDDPHFSSGHRQSRHLDAKMDPHKYEKIYASGPHIMLNNSTINSTFKDESRIRSRPLDHDFESAIRKRTRPSKNLGDLIDLQSFNSQDTCDILTLFDPFSNTTNISIKDDHESTSAHLRRGLIPPPPTIVVDKPLQAKIEKNKRSEVIQVPFKDSNTVNSDSLRKSAPKRSSIHSIASNMSMSSTFNENEKSYSTDRSMWNNSSSFAKLRIVRRDQKCIRQNIVSFTNKLKLLRSKFCFEDLETNSGLVLSPRLFSLRDQSLSVKLIIQSPLGTSPITFTCNIKTTIEHLISHAVCSLLGDLKSDDSMENYLLKVTGRDEYFESHRCLADYYLVNHCCKFGMDVTLSLISKDQARKPYLRTEEDDLKIKSLLSDDLFSHSTILDFSDLNYESLSIMIETLEKEAVKLHNDAAHHATNLQPQSLLQTTKAICSLLLNSEPVSITEAKENLSELCRTYKSEANYIRSSINISQIDQGLDRISLTEQDQSTCDDRRSENVSCTDMNSTMVEVIQHALSRLLDHLAEQVDIVSQNLCVDFQLRGYPRFSDRSDENTLQFPCDDDSGMNADFGESPMREISDSRSALNVSCIQDDVSFHVHILAQPCPDWSNQCLDFNLQFEVWYGLSKIAGPICTNSVKQDVSFFPRISFDETLVFTNFKYRNLPRESRLIMTLLGTKFPPLSNNHPGNQIELPDDLDETMRSGSPSSICSTSPMYSASPGSASVLKTHEAVHQGLAQSVFYLFDCDLYLCQGTRLIGLRPFSSEPNDSILQHDYPKRSSPILQLDFNRFGKHVKFPDMLSDRRISAQIKSTSNQKFRFEDLDIATQQDISKVIEDKHLYESLVDDERTLIWTHREYLKDVANALPKVLLSAPDWSHSQLCMIYDLLDDWTIPCPVDSIQLLVSSFPDVYIRKKAVDWIAKLSDDELCDYLPQIVQAIRNEAYLDSALVFMLFEKALSNVRIANLLYWQFKLNTKDETFKQRSETLLNALHLICGSSMSFINSKQEKLLEKLTKVSEKIKNTRESQRLSTLHKELEMVQDYLMENKPNLPIAPSLEVCDIDINSCHYFNSNTLPLRLAFRTCEESCNRVVRFHTYESIFKMGDDLRQDMLAIQIIRIMEKLWLREGLDLRMVTFDCLATDDRQGMVELVRNSDTLRRIQADSHILKGAFEKKTIVEWLQNRNTSELEYQQAVDNFTHSCAGYSVATYVLGICDRHNDNIMVTNSGHLFHIDFGKFLGDAQMMGSIKRDRTPFVLTADMAYVINGGDRPSKKFQTFIELCTMGFNIIRRNRNLFLNLFSLMTESNIPGLSRGAVGYIDKMLMPGLTEAQAMAKFTRMIDHCLNSKSTQVNFFIHNLAQLRFSADNEDRTLLSFIPKTFTKESDGKIKSLQIVKCYKEKTPEKQYYYIVQVLREQQVQPEFILRTYREFSELQMKLSWQFPENTFHALQKSSIFFMDFKRSNIREVAEKRMIDLNIFLAKLLQLPEMISHCDLVYTFFHPILRDQVVLDSEEVSGTFGSREYSESTRNALYHQSNGQIKLSLVYKNTSLIIMVMHSKNLPAMKGTAGPNSYVKTYLLPDPTKRTKQKTRVIRQSCHPTFMELIVYKWPIEHLKNMTLQVSVWDCDYVQVKAHLGSALISLKNIDLTRETIAWYPLR